MSETQEAIRQAGTFGSLPVLKSERVWGFGDFTWVNISLAIATWAFLVGGATALMVGFGQGVLAMVIGNVAGVIIMLLATTVISSRYGVEQYTILRSIFGFGGVALMFFTIIIFTEVGWSALLGAMFGRASAQVSNEVLGTGIDPNSILVTVFALICIIAAWALVAKGPVTIKAFNTVVAPGLSLVILGLIIFLFTQTTWSELMAAPALDPFEDPRLNFALAVEFNLGVAFSWWPIMGSLGRLTKSPRASLWPAFIGLAVVTIIAQLVGMASALTLGDWDPTVWMVSAGGSVLGVLALVFIAFANITSLASIVYSNTLALRQASGKFFATTRWEVLAGIFLVPAAIVSFFPGLLYDQFLLFVTLTGAFLSAVCGTVIADYFILRKQRISLKAIYAPGKESAYHFHAGFNLAAVLSSAGGSIVYLWLYNPTTLETQEIFSLVTASIPAVVVALVLHLVLTPLFNSKKSGRGGYELPTELESAR
ncbi:MAG: NCS1 family nucleobase:cation symporter-1 [Pontimonas sp.]|jgi:NCS1 family nucleobase:cation symporter-1